MCSERNFLALLLLGLRLGVNLGSSLLGRNGIEGNAFPGIEGNCVTCWADPFTGVETCVEAHFEVAAVDALDHLGAKVAEAVIHELDVIGAANSVASHERDVKGDALYAVVLELADHGSVGVGVDGIHRWGQQNFLPFDVAPWLLLRRQLGCLLGCLLTLGISSLSLLQLLGQSINLLLQISVLVVQLHLGFLDVLGLDGGSGSSSRGHVRLSEVNKPQTHSCDEALKKPHLAAGLGVRRSARIFACIQQISELGVQCHPQMFACHPLFRAYERRQDVIAGAKNRSRSKTFETHSCDWALKNPTFRRG